MSRSACLLMVLGSGCAFHETPFGLGAPRTSDWFDTGKVQKPGPEIARTVHSLLLRQGYQLPPFDPSASRFETEWDVHLSTHWREGYRVKIEAEIRPLDEGGFNVRVRSTMEINDTSNTPGVEERAQWIPAGVSDKYKDQINLYALQINTQLKSRFFGLNP